MAVSAMYWSTRPTRRCTIVDHPEGTHGVHEAIDTHMVPDIVEGINDLIIGAAEDAYARVDPGGYPFKGAGILHLSSLFSASFPTVRAWH